jgi:hypothetical protein
MPDWRALLPKFYANNLIYSATITASTTNANYPASNIKSDFRTKVWRSTSNSDNVVFDFGQAVEIDSICVMDNWQSGFGFTAMTIEANATNTWGAPAFTTTLTKDDVWGVGIKEITAQTYRYWRLVLTSTLGYCEIANLFIGKRTEFTTNGLSYGYSFSNQDLLVKSNTVYGQEFFDDYGTTKEMTGISLSSLNVTELEKVLEVSDYCRTTRPFFFDPCSDAGSILTDDDRIIGQYKLTNEVSFSHKTAGLFDVTLNMREQK